jgi:glucose/arabinose dehydrogenase
MAQLRKDTLAQINGAQSALKARPDKPAADELARATAAFTRVAQRVEQREQSVVQTMTATLHNAPSASPAQKQAMMDTYGLVDDALVEEYNAELRGLVSDLKGLQEAQASVNTLVTHQQSLLDVTEQNVVVADQNISVGTADIEETRDLACAIRWKKLIIALVVVGILVIIGVIITVVVLTQNKPKPASPSPTTTTSSSSPSAARTPT